MKGYVIEKYTDMAGAYTCHRLIEEADKLGIDLKIIGVSDLCVTDSGLYFQSEPLEARDFAVIRVKTGVIKKEICRIVRRSFNDLELFETYLNKYEQVKNLCSSCFRMPEYVLATGECAYEVLGNRLNVPFVAKGLESSEGKEVFLIDTKETYHQLMRRFGKEKEWLFEEFIAESKGRDIRFFSVRGQVVACMTRTSVTDDFRANVALGGRAEKMEITPEIRKIAEEIYLQTKLDFVGIDLLNGDPLPYFCEINVMPGMAGIEKATGINVAGAVMKMIKEQMDNDEKE